MTVKLRQVRADYPDLTPGLEYGVIGIEAGDLRVLSDRGRPYLYPAELFEVVDPREPGDWVTVYGDEGERYAYPPLLNGNGFFEDFFAEDEKAVAVFWRTVNRRLAATMAL